MLLAVVVVISALTCIPAAATVADGVRIMICDTTDVVGAGGVWKIGHYQRCGWAFPHNTTNFRVNLYRSRPDAAATARGA